jgi:hypothetical protein
MKSGKRGRGGVALSILAVAAGCSSTHEQRTLVFEAGAPDASGGASGAAGAGGSGGSSASGGGGSSASGGGGSSASGGSGGTAGGAGSSGAGAGGSDADSGDAIEIQRIKDGTIASGVQVRVAKVFVTALRQTAAGDLQLVVQEPQGETPLEYAYPEFAAVLVFSRRRDADASAAVPPVIGDCVDVIGLTGEFQTLTQVTSATVIPATGCATPPSPLTIPSAALSFADVATDSDPTVAGNQPGAKAERLESVLIRITNASVAAVPEIGFEIVERSNPSGPRLLVLGVYHSASPSVGLVYASITGILSQSGDYRLLPRSAADLVQ